MEWFFEDWVRGTGVPHYRVEFSVHRSEKGVVVRGKLFQQGVPARLSRPSAIRQRRWYAPDTLGHRDCCRPETAFHFTMQSAPPKS